jgi:hypothetical protein
MIITITERAKGFLLNPAGTFCRSRTDAPIAVFTYFGVLLLINAILSTLVAIAVGFGRQDTLAGIPEGIADPVIVFFLVLGGGIIFMIAGSVWIHLWVYLLGGRRGIMQTVTAVIYAGTPVQLLSWIPLIGIITVLWSLVLTSLGIRELQEISTGKAILAIAIAVIIPLGLIILAAGYYMISSPVVTQLPASPGYP